MIPPKVATYHPGPYLGVANISKFLRFLGLKITTHNSETKRKLVLKLT